MSTHKVSDSPNLEFYRKQAKALLQAVKGGDAQSLQRLECFALASRVSLLSASSAALNDAQRTISHEAGFPNWAAFRKHLLDSTALVPLSGSIKSKVTAFVTACMEDIALANRLLHDDPTLAEVSLAAALCTGNSAVVNKWLSDNPHVNTPIEPLNWSPILYVCFSRFASLSGEQQHSISEIGKEMLSRGANPNAAYTPDHLPDNPLPALYGASGLNSNLELTTALIDAGAILDDTESLYHSLEHKNKSCMKLLLERGAAANAPNILFHALDFEDVEVVKALFDAGASPLARHAEMDQTPLHWAVMRNRSAVTILELIDRGVELDAVQADGKAAYQLAYRMGQMEICSLLEKAGAAMNLSEVDRFFGEVATADEAKIKALSHRLIEFVSDKEVEGMLPHLAMVHRTETLKAFLTAGADVNAQDSHGATALHWSCWYGFPDIAELVLEYGASADIRDEQFNAAASGWFTHGQQHCPDRGGNWYEIARLLVQYQIDIPTHDLSTNNEAINTLLRDAGYNM